MGEFDRLSPNYKAILDHDVRIFGETAEYFADYKAEYVKKFLGDDFEGRLLDYGCGIGLVAKSLRSRFDLKQVEIVGFDVSRESIRECKNNIHDAKFTYNLDEIEASHFDAVIMANVLHHIKPDSRLAFLKKASGLLKQGGCIFIFEHNPYNPITKLVVNLSVLDRDTSLIKLSEMIGLLSRVTLDIREKRYIVFFPRCLRRLRPFEPRLGRIPIGAQYVCIAYMPRP